MNYGEGGVLNRMMRTRVGIGATITIGLLLYLMISYGEMSFIQQRLQKETAMVVGLREELAQLKEAKARADAAAALIMDAEFEKGRISIDDEDDKQVQDQRGSGTRYYRKPQIAVVSGGNVIVVWPEGVSTNMLPEHRFTESRLWFSHFDVRKNSWGRARVLESPVWNVESIDIAVDQQSKAMLSWQSGGGGANTNQSKRLIDGFWYPKQSISNKVNAELPASIVFDHAGNAFAVWSNRETKWFENERGRWNDPNIMIDRLFVSQFLLEEGSPRRSHWAEPQQVGYVEGGQIRSPQIAVDLGGNIVVTWVEGTDATAEIHINCYDAKQHIWTGGKQFEESRGVVGAPQLVLDAEGNALVVWQQFQRDPSFWFKGHSLRFVRYMASERTWSKVQKMDIHAEPVSSLQLAMDKGTGEAVAVWTQHVWDTTSADSSEDSDSEPEPERSEVVISRYKPGAGWQPVRIFNLKENSWADSPRIAFNGQGNALLIWNQREYREDSRARVFSSYYTTSKGWSSAMEIAPEPGLDEVETSRVVMDDNGNALLSWLCSECEPNDIFAARYVVGKGWQKPVAISEVPLK